MSLTREQIIQREIDYFKSPLAAEPAFISAATSYDDEFYSSDGKCVYKTEDGRKCAVGALIKPALYESKIDAGDGTSVTGLPDSILNYLGDENLGWLSDLQRMHDDLARDWEFHKESKAHFGRFFLERAKEQRLL